MAIRPLSTRTGGPRARGGAHTSGGRPQHRPGRWRSPRTIRAKSDNQLRTPSRHGPRRWHSPVPEPVQLHMVPAQGLRFLGAYAVSSESTMYAYNRDFSAAFSTATAWARVSDLEGRPGALPLGACVSAATFRPTLVVGQMEQCGDTGSIPAPTSTPSGSGVARVTPIRPALQPAAIMVFMALYPRRQRPAEPAGSARRGAGLCGTSCVSKTAQVMGPF